MTPRKMGIMILATFASMGLPGLIGFTSAIFVYFGLFFQRLYELSSGAVFG